MFVDRREKISSKKIIFSFYPRISLNLVFFHLSSSCWVCFPCRPRFFLLLSVSLTAFPNLLDYFILLFTPFSLTSYPPALAPCISYFHAFSSLLSAFSLFFFPLSPFLFLFITCLCLLAPSHPFLSYNLGFTPWI